MSKTLVFQQHLAGTPEILFSAILNNLTDTTTIPNMDFRGYPADHIRDYKKNEINYKEDCDSYS